MNWLVLAVCLLGGPLSEMDSTQIDAELRDPTRADASFAQRLTYAARAGLGTPYQDGPLGEGPGGKYDTDPMVDFRKVDCVTYVEQSLAVALSSNYHDLLTNLQKIRYENAVPDFEHRNHFMISDWVANNSYIVDVSDELGVETDSITRTISRTDFFELVKAPGLGKNTADEKVTIRVVPPREAKEAQVNIPSPALVVFVGKVDWLFSLHCGLYLRDEAGRGRLFHGSSKAGEVVEMDLADYMNQQGDRYLGFTAYRIDEPGE